jgi:hypothetical protein
MTKMAKRTTKPAPPPLSPFDANDLANAQQIKDVADQLLPLLQKGINCGVVQCSTYLQQVQAQRDFAVKILAEFAAGDTAI